MAFQSVWYYTDLPEDIVDIIERTYLKLLMNKWETQTAWRCSQQREKELTKRMDSNDSLGRWFLVALYSTRKPRELLVRSAVY